MTVPGMMDGEGQCVGCADGFKHDRDGHATVSVPVVLVSSWML